MAVKKISNPGKCRMTSSKTSAKPPPQLTHAHSIFSGLKDQSSVAPHRHCNVRHCRTRRLWLVAVRHLRGVFDGGQVVVLASGQEVMALQSLEEERWGQVRGNREPLACQKYTP